MGERASSFTKDKWWLVANVLGAAAYVWLSSWTWLEPELRGEDVARAGDAMVWGMTALPVLVGFALADLVWLMRRLGKGLGRQHILLAAMLWVFVVAICRTLS